MKNLTWVICLLFGNITYSQSALVIPPDYISHSNIGTITLLATSIEDKKNASANAIESAFNALLFHGIAEAPKPKLRAPFIKDEKKAWENNPDFLKELFHQKGYLRYIDEIGNPEKTKIKSLSKKKAYQIEMTINYEALLRDIRKEGLISKPGF